MQWKQVYLFQFRSKIFIPEQTPLTRSESVNCSIFTRKKKSYSEVKSPSMIAGASLYFMGGPHTGLKNKADSYGKNLKQYAENGL
jgi:hypothetical protein